MNQKRLEEVARKLLSPDEIKAITNQRRREWADNNRGLTVAQIVKAIAQSRKLRKSEARTLLKSSLSKASHAYYSHGEHGSELGRFEHARINHTVNGILDHLVSDAAIKSEEVKVAMRVIDDFSRFLSRLELVHSKKKSIRRMKYYFSKLRLYVKLRSVKSVQRVMRCIVALAKWIDFVLVKVVERVNHYVVKALERPSEPINKKRACAIIRKQIRRIIKRLRKQIAKASPQQKKSILVAVKELRNLISVIARPGAAFLGALVASKNSIKGLDVSMRRGLMGSLSDVAAAKEFLNQADAQLITANSQLLKDIEQFQKGFGKNDPTDDKKSALAALDDVYADIVSQKANARSAQAYEKSANFIMKVKKCVTRRPAGKRCRKLIKKLRKLMRKANIRSKNLRRVKSLLRRLRTSARRAKKLRRNLKKLIRKFRKQRKNAPKKNKKVISRLVRRLRKIGRNVRRINLRQALRLLRKLKEYIRKTNRTLRGRRFAWRMKKLLKRLRASFKSLKNKKQRKAGKRVIKLLKRVRSSARRFKLRSLRHQVRKLARFFSRLPKSDFLNKVLKNINKRLQKLQALIQKRKLRRQKRNKRLVRKFKRLARKSQKALKRMRNVPGYDKVATQFRNAIKAGQQFNAKELGQAVSALEQLATQIPAIKDDLLRVVARIRRLAKRVNKIALRRARRAARRAKMMKKFARKLRNKLRRQIRKAIRKTKRQLKKAKDAKAKQELTNYLKSLKQFRSLIKQAQRSHFAKFRAFLVQFKAIAMKLKKQKFFLRLLKRFSRLTKRAKIVKRLRKILGKKPKLSRKGVKKGLKKLGKRVAKYGSLRKARKHLKRRLRKDRKKAKRIVKKHAKKITKFIRIIKKYKKVTVVKRIVRRLKKLRRDEKRGNARAVAKDRKSLSKLTEEIEDVKIRHEFQQLIVSVEKVEKTLISVEGDKSALKEAKLRRKCNKKPTMPKPKPKPEDRKKCSTSKATPSKPATSKPATSKPAAPAQFKSRKECKKAAKKASKKQRKEAKKACPKGKKGKKCRKAAKKASKKALKAAIKSCPKKNKDKKNKKDKKKGKKGKKSKKGKKEKKNKKEKKPADGIVNTILTKVAGSPLAQNPEIKNLIQTVLKDQQIQGQMRNTIQQLIQKK